MSLNRYSNLEHLREVAMNLYSSDDHANINELCEKELAALIHTFYQGQEDEVRTSGEKRKNEVDSSKDSKKLRVLNKLSDIVSPLELLPNEVYEMILKDLGGEDQKNLRITSKRLKEKTTQMAPIFKEWCFEASRRISQDFIWNTNKNIRVHALKTKQPIDSTIHLINGFSHRISSIRIDFKGLLLNNLERKPAHFSNLTSLDLESVKFSNDSLLMLAPQLEKLRLVNIKNSFEMSTVDSDSKGFSKLRNLILINIDIDLKRILTKCCHTLKSLELEGFTLNNLEEELTCLNYLSISPGPAVPDQLSILLTKCSGSLRTLKLDFLLADEIDLSTLLNQTMKITTLVVMEYEGNNLDQFLNKCPLVQKLTLRSYRKAIDDVVLKDLRKLEVHGCSDKFVIRFLKNVSSLKTLYLTTDLHAVQEIEFPVISELDTLWISGGRLTEMEQVSKLFPNNVKLTTETLGDKTVLRRVYDLP